ncbi:MAG TPA: vWA domain-containing protein [Pyrinomonadaceae bacterium]|nr:vWA domain-containing protein [Pyrinomonadaceae bacterium]
MKRLSLRIAAALLTFVVGVGATVALVRNKEVTDPAPAPPVEKSDGETLEMVFVLDTTGSMGGLLEGAKQRIWGIVNEVMQTPSKPSVRVGLVAYRDTGDAYVTQVLPLTNDLDKVYTTLMDYRAEGGGDWAENVRRGLADGVTRAGWSPDSANSSRIIFLVGDAPPHDDYQHEPDTLATTAEAVRAGMVVNTIQCGDSADTRRAWQEIARRGEGQYFAIAQDGGVRTIATPYDARLSELGGRLGATFMAYGGGPGTAGIGHRQKAAEDQARVETRVSMNASAPASAERAVNKALNKDAYIGDLLQSVENGTLKLDSVKEEDLPDELQKLSPAERQKEVARRLADRRKVREEIVALSKKRDEFIAAARKKASPSQSGFDTAVATALKQQMARKKK